MTFGHHDLPYDNNEQRMKPREWEVVDEDGEVKGSFYSKKDAIFAAGMLMMRRGVEFFVENVKEREERAKNNLIVDRAAAKKLPAVCKELVTKITASEEYVLEQIVGDMEELA